MRTLLIIPFIARGGLSGVRVKLFACCEFELASPQITTPTFPCHGRQTCSTVIIRALWGKAVLKYPNMYLPAFLPRGGEVKSSPETAEISLPDDWHFLNCGSSESSCTAQLYKRIHVCIIHMICTHHCRRGYLKSPSSAPTL